jgi:hypothetical protein
VLATTGFSALPLLSITLGRNVSQHDALNCADVTRVTRCPARNLSSSCPLSFAAHRRYRRARAVPDRAHCATLTFVEVTPGCRVRPILEGGASCRGRRRGSSTAARWGCSTVADRRPPAQRFPRRRPRRLRPLHRWRRWCHGYRGERHNHGAACRPGLDLSIHEAIPSSPRTGCQAAAARGVLSGCRLGPRGDGFRRLHT